MKDDTRRQRGAPLDASHLPADQKPPGTASGAATGCHRFGRPSNYSLTRRELGRHIGQLVAGGWQLWEIRARFDLRRAA